MTNFLEESLERFKNLSMVKFEAGRQEHGGELTEKQNIVWKAKEEVIDLWFYLDALEYQIDHKTIYTVTQLDK